MKKPVRLEYLDYGTLDARRVACEASVRLNRRLAPAVYLGVVPLVVDADGRLALEAAGTVVEWLEKMTRLPAETMLDRMIADQRLTEDHVRRLAGTLDRFYRALPPEPQSGAEYRHRLRQALDANVEALAAPEYGLGVARIERLRASLHAALRACSALLDARAESGCLREAHGDLRPEHVALLTEPIVIDCLEFNREFRILDPADEIAYLGLECERLGAPWIGPRLLEHYATTSGDRPAPALIDLYQAHRAVLRAKLAAWHTRDHDPATHAHWLDRAATYLALAERRLTLPV
jgi:aminoglycoside phosphotransferase family enzyme